MECSWCQYFPGNHDIFCWKLWNWPFLMKQFYQRALKLTISDWLNLFELLSKSFHFQKSLVTVRSLPAETHPIFRIIISKTPIYTWNLPKFRCPVWMNGIWYMCQVQVFFTWNTLIDTDWMASLANQINALRNKDLTHLRIKHFSNYSEPSVNVGRIRPCFIRNSKCIIHSKIDKRRNSSVYTSNTEGWTQ